MALKQDSLLKQGMQQEKAAVDYGRTCDKRVVELGAEVAQLQSALRKHGSAEPSKALLERQLEASTALVKSLTGDIGTTPMPENSPPRSKLGTLLERAKAITMKQLIHALNMHKSVRMRLGQYLVTYGYISEEQLARALAEQFGLPFVDLATANIETFYAKMIPKHYALKHEILPISCSAGKLTAAVADPNNRMVLQNLKTMTGLSVVPVIATTSAIHDAINRVFH